MIVKRITVHEGTWRTVHDPRGTTRKRYWAVVETLSGTVVKSHRITAETARRLLADGAELA